jgi:hypothetical protein
VLFWPFLSQVSQTMYPPMSVSVQYWNYVHLPSHIYVTTIWVLAWYFSHITVQKFNSNSNFPHFCYMLHSTIKLVENTSRDAFGKINFICWQRLGLVIIWNVVKLYRNLLLLVHASHLCTNVRHIILRCRYVCHDHEWVAFYPFSASISSKSICSFKAVVGETYFK